MAHAHDHEELERVARIHVRYELVMLSSMSRPYIVPTLGDLVGTAMFEACVVHARAMDEFLGSDSDGGWQHRVRATDYFPTADPWIPAFVLNDQERRAISRKVAHVFCDREAAELNWAATGDCTDIAGRLLDGMERFQARLVEADAEERAEWFDAGVREARAALDRARAGRVVVAQFPAGQQGSVPFWSAGAQAGTVVSGMTPPEWGSQR